MTLDQLKTAISEFRQKVRDYRDLMVRSRDNVMPDIVRNGREIGQARTELNGDFGRLEKYIRKFGNNPRMNDGVNAQIYGVYNNAFSDDILLRVGPSTDAVLQDLDYMIGKLNGLTENEFVEIMQPPRKKEIVSAGRNYWHLTNPAWLLWKFSRWIWQHKLISFAITLIGLSAIDYSLAWKNAIWLKNFFFSFF